MAETYDEPDKIKQYMASVEANLEKATGKSVAQWVKIAKTCPYSKPGERLKWFRNEHGLGLARAGLVLWRAFGGGTLGVEDPNRLVDSLFSKSFSGQRPIYDKVVEHAAKLGKGTVSPRKGFVALYRLKQYAALKPAKQGLMLGLALGKYPRNDVLTDVENNVGGDRNRKAIILKSLKDFDANAKQLLKAAFDEA